MSKDLHKIWKALADERLDMPIGGKIILPKRSKHPVQKLKNGYLLSITFSIAFLLVFMVLFFLFEQRIVKISLGFVMLGYIFFLVTNFSMYYKIKVNLPVDQSLRKTLNHTIEFVTANIRFQERAALFIYPIAATSGFLMGGATSGDINSLVQQPSTILLLVICIIVLTPICYLLAHWMYKISYGRWLAELKNLIRELERPG
jgi:Ca2+/Na+ antiporter